MQYWKRATLAHFNDEKTLQLENKRTGQTVIYFYKEEVFHFFQQEKNEYEVTVKEFNALFELISLGAE